MIGVRPKSESHHHAIDSSSHIIHSLASLHDLDANARCHACKKQIAMKVRSSRDVRSDERSRANDPN
jgi:hypothetical protein